MNNKVDNVVGEKNRKKNTFLLKIKNYKFRF